MKFFMKMWDCCFNFSRRAGRREILIVHGCVLVMNLLMLLPAAICALTMSALTMSLWPYSGSFCGFVVVVFGLFCHAIGLCLFWSSTVRRLHDLNLSFFCLLPYFLLIAVLFYLSELSLLWIGLVPNLPMRFFVYLYIMYHYAGIDLNLVFSNLVFLPLLLFLYLVPGSKIANRFGLPAGESEPLVGDEKSSGEAGR